MKILSTPVSLIGFAAKVFKVERLPKTIYIHLNYFCAQACTNRIFFVILINLTIQSNPTNFPSP